MMEYCINFDLHMFAPYFKCCNYDSYNMSLAIQLHYVYFFGSTSFTLTWPSGQVPPIPMWDGIESSGPKICVVVMSDYTSYELVVSNPLNTISQIGKTSPNKRWTLQKNIWKQHLSIYLPHSNLLSCCGLSQTISSSQNFLKRKPLCHPHCWQRRIPWVISDLQFLQWMRPRRKHNKPGINSCKIYELRWWYYTSSLFSALYIYI